MGASGALQHREMITAHANRLMDNWIDKGEVEFVTEFAAPLPQAVISTILGFPLEDMPMTKKWEEAQVRRFVYGNGPKSLMEDPGRGGQCQARSSRSTTTSRSRSTRSGATPRRT